MKAYPYMHKHPTSGETTISSGMDLRDWFAGLAMQAVLINSDRQSTSVDHVDEWIGQYAYTVAKAMMKQRKEVSDE